MSDCWGNIGNTIMDIDGNVYEIITIGDQLWMAENLKVTHYRNGDEIPTGWPSYNGAYAVYNGDPSHTDIYGNLYNWYAVDDSRGVCPEGYHVPTDEEWTELESYLGMAESELYDYGYRGTDQGSQLAGNADLWVDGALENNENFGSSGFLALPGGYRYYGNGAYGDMGNGGYFWSASEGSSDGAWYRALYYFNSAVYRNVNNKRGGFSVRCVKDSE